jgi:hypothetical protein
MAKINRNAPCPCGSDKKFKRCHGAPKGGRPVARREPSNPELQAIIKNHQALETQRVRQQGYGRPIISSEMQGIRFVAIGNQLAYGPWRTFQDFLLNHVRVRLGAAWGQAEMSKPDAGQHPFIHWLRVMSEQMQKHQGRPGEINSMPMYGAASGVVGLAYDLYTIEHHAEDAKDKVALERLLERLRHPDQFLGARHEVRVAGILLRAGFELEWEDEIVRKQGGHGEFIATFPETGRAFWVECKMRQSENADGSLRYTHLVSAALRKTTELERLVFVELASANGRLDPETGGWPGDAINQLRKLEGQPDSASLPPALVIITNFPEHWQLDEPLAGAGAVMEGFKTDRYRMGQEEDLLEAIAAKEANREVEFLWRSMQEHLHIPTTFDGSIHGLDPSTRLLIGQTYELPDGQSGILKEAIVVEQWKQAAGILLRPDGNRIIAKFDLSTEELEAWRDHPDTFFGELKPQNPPARDAMDIYDFFACSYAETPREKLLEFMAHHADIEELRPLSQPELVKRYAYCLAASVAQRNGLPVTPTWQRRLRPVKPRKA